MSLHRDELDRISDLLLAEAEAAGMLPQVHPGDLGVTLETGEQFVARMRRDTNVVHLAPRRRRRLPALVAAAAVASVVGVSLSVAQPWSTPVASADTPAVLDFEFANAKKVAYAPGKDPSSTLLELAKTAAADTTDRGTGPTQLVVTDNWFTNTDNLDATTLIPQINETWANADGSGVLAERRGTPIAPDGRGAPADGVWQTLPVSAREVQPADTFDANFASSLPTQPAALQDALLDYENCETREPGNVRTLCIFSGIRDLYGAYVISPKLASALWTVLADEEGFNLLGTVKDRAGRDGIGISIVEELGVTQRVILIISPTTGQLLGQEKVLVKETPKLDVKAPAILEFTAFLESRYTDAPKA